MNTINIVYLCVWIKLYNNKIRKIVIFRAQKVFHLFQMQKIESHILDKLFEKESYEYLVHSWSKLLRTRCESDMPHYKRSR